MEARLVRFPKNYKCPIANHDAERIQNYIVNIEYAQVECYFHSLNGKTNGKGENKRFLPRHISIYERNEKSDWHKQGDISNQFTTCIP